MQQTDKTTTVDERGGTKRRQIEGWTGGWLDGWMVDERVVGGSEGRKEGEGMPRRNDEQRLGSMGDESGKGKVSGDGIN